MTEVGQILQFIADLKVARPAADKEEIEREIVKRFNLQRNRSLLLGHGYAIRFSEVQGASFSNTVLSLSALSAVDHQPLIVCAVRPQGVTFLLANATLLKRVSHSSHHLRIDNIRGSFNGTDILTVYAGIRNTPDNFVQLFEMHSAFTWAENVGRLVESTNAIVGRDNRFHPTKQQLEIVLGAPERARAAIASPRFAELEEEFRSTVLARRLEILRAAAVENVNLRGNRIEQIVTGSAAAHDLGDLHRDLATGQLLAIDIKTKLSGRPSAPKAYNIDKMLAFHAIAGTVFAFLVLGVDLRGGAVAVRLVPVLDEEILSATVVQHHWAGRTSRGVTQLSGRFDRVLAPGFKSRVDLERARAFMRGLIGE